MSPKAWLPGAWLGYCQAWGVQAVLGAEEQCTLCPPKILASRERGMGIPKPSLSCVFEGLRGDAHLKSSFAEHPQWSLPSSVQLSPVLGRPSWSPAPGAPWAEPCPCPCQALSHLGRAVMLRQPWSCRYLRGSWMRREDSAQEGHCCWVGAEQTLRQNLCRIRPPRCQIC